MGDFSYEFPVSIQTPSSLLENGKIFVFSSKKGYVFGESNRYFGFVNLNFEEDTLPKGEYVYNAYSGSLFIDGTELRGATDDDLALHTSSYGSNQIIGGDDKPLNDYIKEKYGDGCKFDCSATLKCEANTQLELSTYIDIKNDYVLSEPNCTLTACYHVFKYLATNKKKLFTMDISEGTPYKPLFEEEGAYLNFALKADQGYAIRDGVERFYGGNNVTKEIKNRNGLYRSIRKASFATKSSWYSSNGMDIWQSSQLAERVANEYGVKGFNAWEDMHYNTYVGTQAFKDNFEKKSNPIIFATSTGVYGSHQIAVFGYRFYRIDNKVLWFNVTEWKCILDVFDGWSKDKRYFDITDYNGNIGGFVIYGYDE